MQADFTEGINFSRPTGTISGIPIPQIFPKANPIVPAPGCALKIAALKSGSTALAPFINKQVSSHPAIVSSIVGTGGTGLPLTSLSMAGFSSG